MMPHASLGRPFHFDGGGARAGTSSSRQTLAARSLTSTPGSNSTRKCEASALFSEKYGGAPHIHSCRAVPVPGSAGARYH
jgi:hypothetical protein